MLDTGKFLPSKFFPKMGVHQKWQPAALWTDHPWRSKSHGNLRADCLKKEMTTPTRYTPQKINMEPEKGPKGKRAKHIYKPPTFKRFHVKFRGMFKTLKKIYAMSRTVNTLMPSSWWVTKKTSTISSSTRSWWLEDSERFQNSQWSFLVPLIGGR